MLETIYKGFGSWLFILLRCACDDEKKKKREKNCQKFVVFDFKIQKRNFVKQNCKMVNDLHQPKLKFRARLQNKNCHDEKAFNDERSCESF